MKLCTTKAQRSIKMVNLRPVTRFEKVVFPIVVEMCIRDRLHTAAVTGAILCVITGCLKEKEAYAGIAWVTIFLFAGMLSVATAMEKTGAGKLIADTVVNLSLIHI